MVKTISVAISTANNTAAITLPTVRSLFFLRFFMTATCLLDYLILD